MAIKILGKGKSVARQRRHLRLRKKILDHSRRKVEENRLARVG